MSQIVALQKNIDEIFLEYLHGIFPHKSYKFKLVELHFDEIIPLCKYVYVERLKQSIELNKLYKSKNINLFLPVKAYYDDGKRRYIAPPVVELRGKDKILCDGTHRLYALLNEKPEKIIVIFVEQPELVLPGQYNTWGNIAVQEIQLPSSANFIDFNRSGLTGYSKLFNGEKMWLK